MSFFNDQWPDRQDYVLFEDDDKDEKGDPEFIIIVSARQHTYGEVLA